MGVTEISELVENVTLLVAAIRAAVPVFLSKAKPTAPFDPTVSDVARVLDVRRTPPVPNLETSMSSEP